MQSMIHSFLAEEKPLGTAPTDLDQFDVQEPEGGKKARRLATKTRHHFKPAASQSCEANFCDVVEFVMRFHEFWRVVRVPSLSSAASLGWYVFFWNLSKVAFRLYQHRSSHLTSDCWSVLFSRSTKLSMTFQTFLLCFCHFSNVWSDVERFE